MSAHVRCSFTSRRQATSDMKKTIPLAALIAVQAATGAAAQNLRPTYVDSLPLFGQEETIFSQAIAEDGTIGYLSASTMGTTSYTMRVGSMAPGTDGVPRYQEVANLPAGTSLSPRAFTGAVLDGQNVIGFGRVGNLPVSQTVGAAYFNMQGPSAGIQDLGSVTGTACGTRGLTFGSSCAVGTIDGVRIAVIGETAGIGFNHQFQGLGFTDDVCPSTYMGPTIPRYIRTGCVWVYDISNPTMVTAIGRISPPVALPAMVGPASPLPRFGASVAIDDRTNNQPFDLFVGAPGSNRVIALDIGIDAQGNVQVIGSNVNYSPPTNGQLDYGSGLTRVNGRLGVRSSNRSDTLVELDAGGAQLPTPTGVDNFDPDAYMLASSVFAGDNAAQVTSRRTTVANGPQIADHRLDPLFQFWTARNGASELRSPSPPFQAHRVMATGGGFALIRDVEGGTDTVDVIWRAASGATAESYLGGNNDVCDGAVVPNATGLPGQLTVNGFPFAWQNGMSLVASQLPPNVPGFFLASPFVSFTPQGAGSFGNLCIGQPGPANIGRLLGPNGALNSGPNGTFTLDIDITSISVPGSGTGFQLGETLYFQGWNRDVNASGVVGSNFTEAVGVFFQ